jgi:hypothetical protein
MLLSSKGALNKLVQQTPVIRIHGGTISQAMQQLKRNMKDCPVNANASCQNNSSHKVNINQMQDIALINCYDAHFIVCRS